MKKNAITALVCFLFLIQKSQAESVELKTLLSEALGESYVVKKSEAALNEASWKKTESYQGYLPTLSAGVNYLLDKKYMLVNTNIGGRDAEIAQIVPTTIYSLNASVPLFDGFASTNRYFAAKNLEQSAVHELEWSKFSVQKQVTLQFYKTLAAQALRDVSEQNLKTLNDHLKDVQALKSAGIATSFDVLRVEVQVSEAKSELLNTQDNFELAKYKLGEILGKNYEPRDVAGKWPTINDQTVEKIQNLKLENRLDLLALKEKVQSLKDLDKSASRYWIPKISAFGQYQHYNNINNKFSDEDNFRDAYQLGVNLSWNIFDGMGSISKSHQASAQAIQLEATQKMSEIKAIQDFEFWKRKFSYFKTILSSRKVEIQKSTEAIRFAKEGRRAGVRTSAELLDAELDLFRSRAGDVNAQIGVIEALINLELVTGQNIYDFN